VLEVLRFKLPCDAFMFFRRVEARVSAGGASFASPDCEDEADDDVSDRCLRDAAAAVLVLIRGEMATASLMEETEDAQDVPGDVPVDPSVVLDLILFHSSNLARRASFATAAAAAWIDMAAAAAFLLSFSSFIIRSMHSHHSNTQ